MPKEPHMKPTEVAERSKSKKTKVGDPIPPPPDRPQQCHYWVARKRRYCHLPSKKTNKYCGEHLTEQQKEDITQDSRIRVPCPFDPQHTVFQDELDVHLKTRCNARPKPSDPWYTLNVNCTLPLSKEELEFQQSIHSHKHLKSQPWIARVQLHELPKNELRDLILKVERLYKEVVPPIKTKIHFHPSMEKRRAQVKYHKHADQQASLLGHMADHDMLKKKHAAFVEFGAGRGELSHHLKAALNAEEGESTFVLIDRKAVRGKFDTALAGEKGATKVKRINIDIKDLWLSNLDALKDESGHQKPMIAYSKHLCGSATDLTLKCLENYVEDQKAHHHNSNAIPGIIIALCCHQLCRYEMYPNTQFLEDNQISKTDYDRICKMTSWAICGQPKALRVTDEGVKIPTEATSTVGIDSDDEGEEHHHTVEEEGDFDDTSAHYSGLDHESREAIGFACKRILDAGRAEFLRQHGFHVELVYYADRKTTLENCALIATHKEDH
ncbi:methyltransferase TRM13-domain-containing protein [Umbelopsis sp. PMI_123]|nr:methyltransferase TRM13-domain-containing protein [Umbelopsis sp. PMI_123]